MRKDNVKPYPELGPNWTIVWEGDEHGAMYHALNIKTGKRMPTRYTYERALEDIPKEHPRAEPWGV